MRATTPVATPSPRSRIRRWLIGIGAAGSVLIVAVTVRKAGTWLIVSDQLQPAQSIVVFGGGVPFRAMEAALIYQEGWAPQVWLTQPGRDAEDEALARAGVDRPVEDTYSRLVLERMGVPDSGIRVPPGRVSNTADEVELVAPEVRGAGDGRVILVTSKYHSRRVRATWRALVGASPEAVVRYTREDPRQHHPLPAARLQR